MKISTYDIDLEEAVQIINKKNYKRVLVQIPEGLKIHFPHIVGFLQQNTKAEIIISANPCFGACDIPTNEQKNLAIDFFIQIGHTQIPELKKSKTPILFINAKSELDVSKVVEKALTFVNGKKIGLVTTAQHIHKLDEVNNILQKKNFETLIGKGDTRIESAGQILGCNFSAANSIAKDVDMFLFIGSGNFHPLGLALTTHKKVLACDPYTGEVKDAEYLKDTILRQRYGAIARSRLSNTFGIIVCTKAGQQRLDLALKLKEKLEARQKKSYILTLDNISAQILDSFIGIDSFISTACPRIAIDDYMQYKKPIITPIELDILLGYKRWEDYSFDEIVGK